MAILLFDDDCLVCNRSVQFVLTHDDGRLQFAALQSEVGQQAVKRFGLEGVDSVVLVDDDVVYTHSSAALEITKYLKGAWKSLVLLRVVPRFLRDVVYRFIAKNRKKIPLKQCMLLTPEQRKRFIG